MRQDILCMRAARGVGTMGRNRIGLWDLYRFSRGGAAGLCAPGILCGGLGC